MKSDAISALNTPPLTNMDSDDEFMSGLSSEAEGFDVEQESDDGSLGDGLTVIYDCNLYPKLTYNRV